MTLNIDEFIAEDYDTDCSDRSTSGLNNFQDRLEQGILSLPPHQILILQLHYIDGLSLADVASVLNIRPLDACIAKASALACL